MSQESAGVSSHLDCNNTRAAPISVNSSSDDDIESSAKGTLTSSRKPAVKGDGTMRQTMLDKDGFAPLIEFNNPTYSSYFKIFDSVNGKSRLQCQVKLDESDKICGVVLTKQKSSFNNIIKHLKIQHSITPTPTADKDQPKISEHLLNQKYRSNHSVQKTFDIDVQNLICVDGVPPFNIELPGFASLVMNLDNKIRIKSRRTYMRQIQNEVSKCVIPSLKVLLATIQPRHCNFSCDIWSSRRREGVMCVMIQFINEEWQLISKVIGFRSLIVAHTAYNIKKVFEDVLNDLDIDISQVGAVVTDNASNMIAAVNLLQLVEDDGESDDGDEVDQEPESSDEAEFCVNNDENENFLFDLDDLSDEECQQNRAVTHHGCVSHSLQLVINKSILLDPAAHSLLQYINSVMVFFKRSTKWTDELRALTQLDVVKPAKTRWNGLLDMLDRFQTKPFYNAARDILYRVHDEPITSMKSPPPSPPKGDCQVRANELYQILRPLGDATDILQANGPTSNNVIISITTAISRLTEVKLQYFKLLKDNLISQTKLRFENILADDDYVLAAFLDPRQKLDVFESEDESDEEKPLVIPSKHKAQSIVTTFFFLEAQKLGINSTNPLPPDLKRKKTMYDTLKKPKSTLQNLQHSELDAYIKEGLIEGIESPLEYWKLKSSVFPILASMAKRYLAIPASTAGVERVFSIRGSIGRARRGRMKSKTMKDVIMLREHRKPLLLKRLQEAYGLVSDCKGKKKRST